MVVRQAMRRISEFYDAVLSPAGLRATQFSILSLVAAHREPSINRLARALDLDRTTMGKNLKPLERDGLVAVGRAAADRRSRVLTLTEAGWARLRQAQPLWRDAQEAFDFANGEQATADLRARLAAVRIPPWPDLGARSLQAEG
jgi:DNA-binding MarR family transcriptional regulator